VDLQGLANIGELITGLAVPISLVYVAMQVRQNTLSLRTENYSRALDRISSMQAHLSLNGELSVLFSKGATDPAALSPAQRIQFTWWAYELFGAFEFIFHQAESRAMPAEVWERWSSTARWWLSFPGIRAWWMARPTPFSASFTAFVEANLAERAPEPATPSRWEAFLRAGSSIKSSEGRCE
jgi:hypothetical protein